MSEAGDSLEIKPGIEHVNPVDVPKTQEAEKTSLDAILVFGQGPVIDSKTREKTGSAGTQKGTEDINFWSRTLAEAAFELYKRGQTREIIVMGGRTGGEEYNSEADLITQALKAYGVPPQAIKREDRSTNTLENLVNVLNEYVDKNPQYKNLGILTANYHLSRTRMLMNLFGIPYKTAFSAEEVLRFVAMQKEGWDHKTLLEIEHRLDMNEASKEPTKYAPGYFPQKQGTERKNIVRRGQEENVWSKALLEVPEYWIGYVGRLQNGERIRQILSNQDQKMLIEKFGINLSSDTNDAIKQKLLSVTRKLPDLQREIDQGWPAEAVQKLEDVIEKRQGKKLPTV